MLCGYLGLTVVPRIVRVSPAGGLSNSQQPSNMNNCLGVDLDGVCHLNKGHGLFCILLPELFVPGTTGTVLRLLKTVHTVIGSARLRQFVL